MSFGALTLAIALAITGCSSDDGNDSADDDDTSTSEESTTSEGSTSTTGAADAEIERVTTVLVETGAMRGGIEGCVAEVLVADLDEEAAERAAASTNQIGLTPEEQASMFRALDRCANGADYADLISRTFWAGTGGEPVEDPAFDQCLAVSLNGRVGTILGSTNDLQASLQGDFVDVLDRCMTEIQRRVLLERSFLSQGFTQAQASCIATQLAPSLGARDMIDMGLNRAGPEVTAQVQAAGAACL